METFDVTNPNKPVIIKDPDALLDYTFDWTAWLASAATPADKIVAATFTVSTGATVQTSAFDDNRATAWIAGGTPGTTHSLQCRITTLGGRTDDRTVYLKIKHR